MHDIGSEEVRRHLKHENDFAASLLEPLSRRARELHLCMLARQPDEAGQHRRSVPERLGPYLYYTRRDEGKAFPVYVRRPVEGGLCDEHVVLDLNEVDDVQLGNYAGEHGEVPPPPRLGSMKLSPDQSMLACTIDFKGDDRYTLEVFDLGRGTGAGGSVGGKGGAKSTSRGSPIRLSGRKDPRWEDVVGVEWGARVPCPDGDDRRAGFELYYTVPDELRRPWQALVCASNRSCFPRANPTACCFACFAQVRRGLLRPTARQDIGVAGVKRPGVFPGELGQRHSADEEKNAGLSASSSPWEVDDSAGEVVVFEELDDAFFVDVGKTKDSEFVVINAHSKTTSEIFLLPASTCSNDRPARVEEHERTHAPDMFISPREARGSPTLVRRRQPGVEYYLDHCGDGFYIVTNAPRETPSGKGTSRPVDPIISGHRASGEYYLSRLKQPGGRGSLRGIGESTWEVVPVGSGPPSTPISGGPGPGDAVGLETNRGVVGEGVAKKGHRSEREETLRTVPERGTPGAFSSSGDAGPGIIDDMDIFRDHCVLYEASPSGSPQVRVVPVDDPAAALVVSPPSPGGCGGNTDSSRDGVEADTKGAGSVSVLRPGVNSWFEARTARFILSSPTAPEDVYDLCLDSGAAKLLRRTNVPGEPVFDGRDFSCYRVEVESRDGERVPLTIAHRQGLELKGANRLLLHGYGAYGMKFPMDYHPGYACMLERGWVLAFAHVRGGGEKGRGWHASGKALDKWNSFWDLEACAEYLVSKGFTVPARMGLHTSSAGGLLAGVMANTRSNLFGAMVMKAPFLGVYSAMRDPSLPLTVHEFDEWGDPNTSAIAEKLIQSYCPYENVRRQAYPALLITTSTKDSRVKFWDSAKWVSRVRAANTGSAPVILRVSDSDGHDGPDDAFDGLRDSALEMAFLEEHL